jgi:4-diphosphocytidyl-2-C-methyl-D-erythritol kinase
MPLEQLAQIGLSLGADVPFFLQGRHAWVEGIGEKITPIALPASRYVVAKPDAGLDTKLIFSDSLLKRDTKPATISGFAADVLGFGQNDLQEVAEKLCPGVTQALRWLESQGLRGRMTGSGSAVFAPLLSEVQLGNVPDALQVKVCSSLDVHPLLGWARSNGLSVVGF